MLNWIFATLKCLNIHKLNEYTARYLLRYLHNLSKLFYARKNNHEFLNWLHTNMMNSHAGITGIEPLNWGGVNLNNQRGQWVIKHRKLLYNITSVVWHN